jgi:multisubunit Na+/H+ antiporter MnhE subunit
MSRFVLVTMTLTTAYLLVLASVHPGDVLTGVTISAIVAAVSRRPSAGGTSAPTLLRRLAGAPRLALGTLGDMLRGTWHVALHILGTHRFETPGIVAIPAGERTVAGIAAWGYLTAVSPDEIVVDVDETRGMLLVHVLDTTRADTVRGRHRMLYERRQGRVFP